MVQCICVFELDRAWLPSWLQGQGVSTAPRLARVRSGGVVIPEEEIASQTLWEGFRAEVPNALARNRFLSSLLVFIPIGYIAHFCWLPEWMSFTANFLAVLPMAWLIGKATEDLAAHTSELIGGLLNATFGNVVEMLLCVAGIMHDEVSLIQCTLVGSILSNMLLVMGTAFFVGGLVHHKQRFSEVSAGAQASMMLFSVLGILLPTMYGALVPSNEAIRPISRGSGLLLFLSYIQYLMFQLWTHADFIEAEEKALHPDDGEEKEEEHEEVDLTFKSAALLLFCCTVLTAFSTDFLIDSLGGFIREWKISKEFVGIIMLPIIGNAAEHWTAIIAAYHDKMDLSLGVAIGSSCQMALLVTPFTVFLGWVFKTNMTLDFHPFQAVVLFLSVLIVASVLKDGESNWLLGSMLFTAYVIIAVCYFHAGYDGGPSVTYSTTL